MTVILISRFDFFHNLTKLKFSFLKIREFDE